VGSNIFNIFWILGVTAIIRPLPLAPSVNSDLGVAALASMILFLWMFVGKKHELGRWNGIVFVALYVAYIAFVVTRG
jgi:cation:H+ antiporter